MKGMKNEYYYLKLVSCYVRSRNYLCHCFYWGGKDEGKTGNKTPMPFICLLLLTLLTMISSISFAMGRKVSKQEMRRRLNQPIVSKEQLYGYKIVDKKFSENESLEDSLSSLVCLISIEDLLGDKHILLEDVEASEKFFLKLKVGDRFLPEIDSNVPATEN